MIFLHFCRSLLSYWGWKAEWELACGDGVKEAMALDGRVGYNLSRMFYWFRLEATCRWRREGVLIEMLLKMPMVLLLKANAIFVGKRGSSAVSCSKVLLLLETKSSHKESSVTR